MRIIVESLGKEKLTLTAYLHYTSSEMTSAAVRPALLIFPGEGYFVCSDREAEPIALVNVAEGYNAVGRETQYTESFVDAHAMIKMLHKNADTWNIDKTKIATIGFSVGGHLASAFGILGVIRPNVLILGYPAISAIFSGERESAGNDIPSTNEHANDKTPPTFIFSARDDKTVPTENSL